MVIVVSVCLVIVLWFVVFFVFKVDESWSDGYVLIDVMSM